MSNGSVGVNFNVPCGLIFPDGVAYNLLGFIGFEFIFKEHSTSVVSTSQIIRWVGRIHCVTPSEKWSRLLFRFYAPLGHT